MTVGQLVQIGHGSMKGLIGLVTEVRNQFRLIISVDLLMRSVSVDVDRSWVRPIGNARPERSQALALKLGA
jgi:transcription antitermination factor NusG